MLSRADLSEAARPSTRSSTLAVRSTRIFVEDLSDTLVMGDMGAEIGHSGLR